MAYSNAMKPWIGIPLVALIAIACKGPTPVASKLRKTADQQWLSDWNGKRAVLDAIQEDINTEHKFTTTDQEITLRALNSSIKLVPVSAGLTFEIAVDKKLYPRKELIENLAKALEQTDRGNTLPLLAMLESELETDDPKSMFVGRHDDGLFDDWNKLEHPTRDETKIENDEKAFVSRVLAQKQARNRVTAAWMFAAKKNLDANTRRWALEKIAQEEKKGASRYWHIVDRAVQKRNPL